MAMVTLSPYLHVGLITLVYHRHLESGSLEQNRGGFTGTGGHNDGR